MLSSFERLIRDRVTSPLFSTFIVSWMLCNWKIFYLTFFIDSNKIYPSNKIEFILMNYLNWYDGLLYPTLSAVFLLFIVPYGEKVVYKSYLSFRADRLKMKQERESESYLSKALSKELRLEMVEQQSTHEKEITKKDKDIKLRDQVINDFQLETKRLKIHYAAYGDCKVGEKWKEVTQDVTKGVDGNNTLNFTIQNNAFSILDPAEGVDKDFFMVFEKEGVVKNFWAKEYNSIHNEDATYVTTSNDKRQI